MTKKEIIDKLRSLQADIPRLKELHPKSNEDVFYSWKESVACYILTALDNDMNNPIYLRLDKFFSEGQNNSPAFRRQFLTPSELKGAESVMENVISLLEGKNDNVTSSSARNQMNVLTNIFQNFHRFAQQLQVRQKNAGPIFIEDEYALQDFVHAILCLHFDKVENEVWLPPYCGKSSRIDFYLKEERIGIEVKYASENLKKSEIRKQLIEDKEQYIKSGYFDVIIFFIYNPKLLLKKQKSLMTLQNRRTLVVLGSS